MKPTMPLRALGSVSAVLLLTASSVAGATPEPMARPEVGPLGGPRDPLHGRDADAAPASPPEPGVDRGFDPLPQHRFQWAPSDSRSVQVGVNFGLVQLALGGFNLAAEVRYRRLWLEYSHGVDLTLNKLGSVATTQTERDQNVHVFVPYTTGFGVGITLVDELWLGVEWKTHRYEVNAPGGAVTSYQTYSVGPVIGYKLFVYKGLYANAYARYWPNVATSLEDGKVALEGSHGTVTHTAHDFGLFANLSIGYAVDL